MRRPPRATKMMNDLASHVVLGAALGCMTLAIIVVWVVWLRALMQ
jgi:hypothetical protein